MTIDELSWWFAELTEIVTAWAGVERNAALFGGGSA